jgi:uncharacterized membrane protein
MQENPQSPGRRQTWFVLSLLLLLATAGVGAALYPGMPDPVPVHWNGAGEADEFASKSVLAVFSPLVIGAGVLASLWLLHRFLPSRSMLMGGQDAALAEANAEAGRQILAAITPAMAVLFSWLSIQGWLGLTGPAVVWVPMLSLTAYTTIICVRAVRAVAANEPPHSSRRL